MASSIRNSKRVSFGPSLSPEHFDQYLPPKTPVKKGASPSRLNQGRKSLLKHNSPKRITPRKSTSPRRLSTDVNLSAPKANSVSKQPMTPIGITEKRSPSTKASPPSTHVEKNLNSPSLQSDKSQHTSPVNLKSETSTLQSPGSKSASPTSIAKSVLQTANLTPLSPKKGKDTSSFTPRSSKKKLASDSSINDSIFSSQDLFSQMTPVTHKGSQVVEQSAYSEVKMIMKPGRARSDGQNDEWLSGRAKIKKLGMDRAKSLGASPPAHIDMDSHVKINALSPYGGKLFKKTPIVKRLGRPRKVSDESQHGKTAGKQPSEVSLVGIRELVKTPKSQVADISLSGISSLFKSGNRSTPNVRNISATPGPLNQSKVIDTPRPVFSAKRNRPPKMFFDELVSPPKSKSKTPKSTPTSQRKSQLVAQVSSPAKIATPPQDFNKVVALRAIHGHAVTPKLTFGKRGATPKNTPKSTKKFGSIKKSQVVKTWSDVVKLGVPVFKPAITSTSVKTSLIKKTLQVKKQSGRTPKTPRALARALAPTTGHAESPATIIVGKKAMGRGRPKTPKPLPRRGRKESMSKISRTSTGDTSFTGLVDLFASPPLDKNPNESALYAEIPDTPNGPDEMFVSPLSLPKNAHLRRSVNLSGIRELFSQKQSHSNLNLVGIKELMKTPKSNGAVISPTGLKRILKTPKNVSVTPTDLKHLFERNKTKTPAKRGRPSLGSKASEILSPKGKTTPLVKEIEAVSSPAPLNDSTIRRSIPIKEQAVINIARGLKRKADLRDEPATKRAKFSSTPLKARASPVDAASTPKRLKSETHTVESTVHETSVAAQIEVTKKERGNASPPQTKSSVAETSEPPLPAKSASPAVRQERSRKKVEFNVTESFEESGLNNKRVRGKLVTASKKSLAASPVKRKRGRQSLAAANSVPEIDATVVNTTKRGKADKELSIVKSPVAKTKRCRPSLEVASSEPEIDATEVNKTTRGKADNKELSILKSPVAKRKRGRPSLEVATSAPKIDATVVNKTTRGKADNKALSVVKSPVNKRKRGRPSLEDTTSASETNATVVNKTKRGKVDGKESSMSKRSATIREQGKSAQLSLPEPEFDKVEEVNMAFTKSANLESPKAVQYVARNKRAKRGQIVTSEPVDATVGGAVDTHKAANLVSPKAERSVVKRGRGKAAELTISTIIAPEQEVDYSVVTKSTRGRATKAEKPVAPPKQEVPSAMVTKTARGKADCVILPDMNVAKNQRGRGKSANLPDSYVSAVKLENVLSPKAEKLVNKRKRGEPSLVVPLPESEVDAAVVTKTTRGKASKAVEPVAKRKPGRPSLVIPLPESDVDAAVVTKTTRGKASKAGEPVTKRKPGRPSLVIPLPESEVDAAVVTKTTRGKASKAAEPVAKRKPGRPSLVIPLPESEVDAPVVTKTTRGKASKAVEPVAKRKVGRPSLVVTKTTRGKASKAAEPVAKRKPGRPSITGLESNVLISPKAASPVAKRRRGKVTELSPKVTPRAKRGQAKGKSPVAKQKSPVAKQSSVKVLPQIQSNEQGNQAQEQKVSKSKATVQKQSKSKAKIASPKATMATRTRRR
ncbi:unnamed protein product [Lymnaea stagnalis]|uniref:PP1-binding domain-containing protein n=1 Tax=Lymnaea stagnalis TaxID=6523 RepID=A0AAV2HVG5_LYMST